MKKMMIWLAVMSMAVAGYAAPMRAIILDFEDCAFCYVESFFFIFFY